MALASALLVLLWTLGLAQPHSHSDITTSTSVSQALSTVTSLAEAQHKINMTGNSVASPRGRWLTRSRGDGRSMICIRLDGHLVGQYGDPDVVRGYIMKKNTTQEEVPASWIEINLLDGGVSRGTMPISASEEEKVEEEKAQDEKGAGDSDEVGEGGETPKHSNKPAPKKKKSKPTEAQCDALEARVMETFEVYSEDNGDVMWSNGEDEEENEDEDEDAHQLSWEDPHTEEYQDEGTMGHAEGHTGAEADGEGGPDWNAHTRGRTLEGAQGGPDWKRDIHEPGLVSKVSDQAPMVCTHDPGEVTLSTYIAAARDGRPRGLLHTAACATALVLALSLGAVVLNECTDGRVVQFLASVDFRQGLGLGLVLGRTLPCETSARACSSRLLPAWHNGAAGVCIVHAPTPSRTCRAHVGAGQM